MSGGLCALVMRPLQLNDLLALQSKLAGIFGLVATSVKVLYQAAPGEWEELDVCADLLAALERQPSLTALPVQVSGEEMLHLPFLHVIATLISVANLGALCAFAYLVVYTASLPMPYAGAIYLPPLIACYNGYAVLSSISDEYVMSAPLRVAFSRKDGNLVTFMLVALLGPDAILLYSRLSLPKLGATLSKTAERDLVFWGAGVHLFEDLPALLINMALHRMGAAWDVPSIVLLVTTGASLSFNLLWHVARMFTVQGEDDDVPQAALARGTSARDGLHYRSPSRRTLRKLDTVSYVGMPPKNPYEA